MAGDWIKFETATPDKPEVWEVSDALSIDPDAVVGKILRVWIWFDQHTEDGNAPIVTKRLLDRLAGVTGFCAALISVGWMLDDGQTLTLPNFERHNGKTAKNRALTAKRVADNRKKNPKSNNECNAPIVTSALPREEKRREEVKTSSSETDSAEEEQKKITYQNIADLYNRVLGETLGKVLALSDQRKKHLAARVKESSKRQSLDWWESYFVLVSETPFLCGHGPPRENGKPWKADFDWLINQNNMVKAIEGTKYQ